MGKKAKKKSGKKKGGKKKKAGEPQMTFKEAILAYQINIKEKMMEDIEYELRAVEEKNRRHKERNERLKQEQQFYLQQLLKQAREFEKKLAGEDVITKEQVVTIMMDKWNAKRQEESNLTNIHGSIAQLDLQISTVKKDVSYWTDYKSRGQHEHQKQIYLLEQELVDMQNSFDEMSAHLTRTLDKSKAEIKQTTDETLAQQKDIASEKAMSHMDKYSRQEVVDNDWLRREVAIHTNDAEAMMRVVEDMEKDNLEIMSELFECNVDDLKISREFFLTQFQDNENLDETGILEMDLSKVSIKDQDDDRPWYVREATKDTAKREQVSGATQRAVEKKVFSLLMAREPVIAEEPETDSDYDGYNSAEDIDPDDPFGDFFQFEDENMIEYLKLGPLELKMLNITGNKVPIYKPKTPPPDEMRAKDFKPDQWPVTHPMLKGAFTPRK